MSDTSQDTTSSSGQNKRRRQPSEAGTSSSPKETKTSGSKRKKRWTVQNLAGAVNAVKQRKKKCGYLWSQDLTEVNYNNGQTVWECIESYLKSTCNKEFCWFGFISTWTQLRLIMFVQ